jgi:threonine dehydrogenase-like Zn-dependent dehydrogenase
MTETPRPGHAPADLHTAVEYRLSVPKYLALRAVTGWWRGAAAGRLGMLRTAERTGPEIRRPMWVRLKPRLAGICGSDLNLVLCRESPSLEPLASPRFVPGHEAVAEVDAVGEGVADLRPGDRVVMDAVLSCAVREIDPPCRMCGAGRLSLCENIVTGCRAVAAGLFGGYNADLGGAWAGRFVAHRAMLHKVPDAVPDHEAVLLEPFCSALHPVLANPPAEGDRVVVLGSGTLGLMTVAALRATGFAGTVLAVAKYPAQAELARRLGATDVLRPGAGLPKAVAEATGASLFRGTLGPPTLLGGPEVVYDSVGSSATVQDALQMVRGGGRVVVVGISPSMSVDSSCLWLKEVRLIGSCGSGGSTMPRALDLAASGKLRLRDLITHRFPLSDWRSALRSALAKGRSGAIKVVFDRF